MVVKTETPSSQRVSFQEIRIELMHAFAKKRTNVSLGKCLPHMDTAPFHITTSARFKLILLDLETTRPPFSPELSPMDFVVFLETKRHLRRHRFNSLHELQVNVHIVI